MKDDHLGGSERADDATYEDEHTSRRTVTIPLKEYDELKEQQQYIKDPSLIAIIDKIEELIRALRKHIIRKWKRGFVLWHLWKKIGET